MKLNPQSTKMKRHWFIRFHHCYSPISRSIAALFISVVDRLYFVGYNFFSLLFFQLLNGSLRHLLRTNVAAPQHRTCFRLFLLFCFGLKSIFAFRIFRKRKWKRVKESEHHWKLKEPKTVHSAMDHVRFLNFSWLRYISYGDAGCWCMSAWDRI